MADLMTFEEWATWKFRGGQAWVEWKPLSESSLGRVPEKPGAYILALRDGDEIGRLLRTDPHGVLDIGESKNLRDRLWSFYACSTTDGATGHMAGWRMRTLRLLEKLRLKPEELRFAWVTESSKEDAAWHEGKMLRMYVELFGEPPPLNYKYNWSAHGAE